MIKPLEFVNMNSCISTGYYNYTSCFLWAHRLIVKSSLFKIGATVNLKTNEARLFGVEINGGAILPKNQ